MPGATTPIVILGGSDRRPAKLPEGVSDKHPLAGHKGVAIRYQGRPLIETIIERLLASGWFGPVYIAGPREVYETIQAPAKIIDTSGTFGENIEASLEQMREKFPGRVVAFTTCDILPEVETLKELKALYEEHAPADMWFPLIRAPKDQAKLGASEWKPSYRVMPGPGEPAVGILPGHLALVDPESLRRKFIYRLFEIAYRTRNRPMGQRQSKMIRSAIAELLYQDLLHILGFRLPTLTYTILRAGVSAGRLLAKGEVTVEYLENSLRKMFIKYRFRRKYPERRIRLPIVDALSLALDMDTEEEAREMGGDVASSSTSPGAVNS